MIKELLSRIESKRKSKSRIIQEIIKIKDLLWKIKEKFKIEFKGIYIHDPFLNKKVNLTKELKKKRKWGISGFMRVKNEEDFIEEVILQVINSLDELVIVYNRCTDRTVQILKKLRKEYPKKIILYHYKPPVYSAGSRLYRKLPADSPNNLVNYSNFALAKTSYKFAIKIDGDDFFIKEVFNTICNNIRKKGLREYLLFRGINLWDENNKIYVNIRSIFTSGRDRGFFPVKKHTYFIKLMEWEHFSHLLTTKFLGDIYFHLKYMKKDRGLENFDSDRDFKKFLKCYNLFDIYALPKLASWQDLVIKFPYLKKIPRPETRIKPLRKRKEDKTILQVLFNK